MKFLFLFCILFVGTETAFGREWRGIVPFRSTRKDVISTFGGCKETALDRCMLETRKEMVVVSFANRTCGTPKSPNPNDIVTRIEVSPKVFTRFTVDKINFDNVVFISIKDPTPYGSAMIADDKHGIAIQTNEKAIRKIYYLPTSEDSGSCPEAYVQPTGLFPHVTSWETPCPTIMIDSPEAIAASRTPVTLFAQVAGVMPILTPTYSWKVSAGRIIDGQNTDAIKIDIGNVPQGTMLEVKLDVGGFPTICTLTTTAKILINGR
jgi:hypothetical protein